MSEWQFVWVVTFCLPTPVRHPFRFVRQWLINEMPPELPGPVQGLVTMECTGCGVPGVPDALPGGLCGLCGLCALHGLCGPCRSVPYERRQDGLPADVVRGRAERIRYEIRKPRGPLPPR